MRAPDPPTPDPAIGEAATANAALGQEYLGFMQGQADITNAWAAEDREFYQQNFVPLQSQYIELAQNYDTPERRNAAASAAAADVRLNFGSAQQQNSRRLAAMGVDPRSTRYNSEMQRSENVEALASAGAQTSARRHVESEGNARLASAINMGSGYAVNPGQSMALSNGATSSGFGGAMDGYNSQADILNMQHQNNMQNYQIQMANQGAMWGSLGSVVGVLPFLSSKEAKTDKRKAVGVLDKLRDMPVEKWRYKDGKGDGKDHIGPYAEDMAKATGVGDGKTINPIDAHGLALGAIKELDAKVDKIARKVAA